MDDFCNQFIERYGNQEVELTHLFDSETGFSYGNNKITATSELLNRLRSIPQAENEVFSMDEWHKVLLSKYIECLKSGGSQIELNINDFSEDGGNRNNTFYFLVCTRKENGYICLKSKF